MYTRSLSTLLAAPVQLLIHVILIRQSCDRSMVQTIMAILVMSLCLK